MTTFSRLLLAGATAVGMAVASQSASAQSFTITSPDFKDGAVLATYKVHVGRNAPGASPAR